MTSTKLKPELRFPEFSDAWNVKNLGELVATIESGVSVNSEDRPKKEGEFGILKTSAISRGNFYPTENKKILPTELVRAKLHPRKDTIIVSRMNTPQLVGESGYVDQTYNDLFIPDRLWSVTVNQENSAKWLSYVLASDKTLNVLSNVASGTSNSMKNISQPSFLAIKIVVPGREEQQKIADSLTAVDQKITSIDKKIELLKQYKKAVMHGIFTQQVRFKDKDGNDFPVWRSGILGELAEIKTGKKDANIATEDGQYRFYTCARFFLHTNTYSFEGEAILIAGNAEVGLCHYYNGKFEAYQRTYVLQNFKINGMYLFKYMAHYFRQYALSLKQTSAMSFLKIDMLNNFIVPLPRMHEQEKIADFLDLIDKRIELEKNRRAKIRSFKEVLVQRMFI